MSISGRIKQLEEKEAAEKREREAEIEGRVQEALRRSKEKEEGITGKEAPQLNVAGGSGEKGG